MWSVLLLTRSLNGFWCTRLPLFEKLDKWFATEPWKQNFHFCARRIIKNILREIRHNINHSWIGFLQVFFLNENTWSSQLSNTSRTGVLSNIQNCVITVLSVVFINCTNRRQKLNCYKLAVDIEDRRSFFILLRDYC